MSYSNNNPVIGTMRLGLNGSIEYFNGGVYTHVATGEEYQISSFMEDYFGGIEYEELLKLAKEHYPENFI